MIKVLINNVRKYLKMNCPFIFVLNFDYQLLIFWISTHFWTRTWLKYSNITNTVVLVNISHEVLFIYGHKCCCHHYLCFYTFYLFFFSLVLFSVSVTTVVLILEEAFTVISKWLVSVCIKHFSFYECIVQVVAGLAIMKVSPGLKILRLLRRILHIS